MKNINRIKSNFNNLRSTDCDNKLWRWSKKQIGPNSDPDFGQHH